MSSTELHPLLSPTMDHFDRFIVSDESLSLPSDTSKVSGFRLLVIKAAKVISSEETVRAVVDLALSVNDIAKAVFITITENAERVGMFLDKALHGLYFFGLVNDLVWWASKKKKSACEKIYKVFSMTLTGIKSTLFLSHVGAFSLSKIAVTIGRIPVIGMVVNTLTIGTYIVHAIKMVKLYRAASLESRGLEAKLKATDLIGADNVKILESIRVQKIIQKSAQLNLIADVISVAFSALVILSFCTGWGALAATGAFMLTLSISCSVFWLYSCYYSEKHQKIVEPSGGGAGGAVDF